jgi:hypothetical protein
MFPTQYATKTAEELQLFFVSPVTLAAASDIVRLTTGPKKPIKEYPTMGTTGRYRQSDFQIITKPDITGRQQRRSAKTRRQRYREQSHPDNVIPTVAIAPSGNWKMMLSRDEYPKVETIRGPKPVTAPFVVNLQKRDVIVSI